MSLGYDNYNNQEGGEAWEYYEESYSFQEDVTDWALNNWFEYPNEGFMNSQIYADAVRALGPFDPAKFSDADEFFANQSDSVVNEPVTRWSKTDEAHAAFSRSRDASVYLEAWIEYMSTP